MTHKRVAIVGGGIAGLAAAHALRKQCHLTLFEQNQLGGHAHTLDISIDGKTHAVDVAFMVYNRRNYPAFCALLDSLQIEGQDADMSFSVVHEPFGLMYNGGSLGGLIADKRNLLRRRFWLLLAEIIRFNHIVKRTIKKNTIDDSDTLQDFLARHRFTDIFCNAYLLPMGASIWSCSPAQFSQAPARFVAAFFNNHGLLDLFNRPQWQTIIGGSRRYVQALINDIPNLHYRNDMVQSITADGEVQIDNERKRFDAIIVAAHAPQALAMLASPTQTQRDILGAFCYTQTEGALHTDSNLLPQKQKARAAWNYRAVQCGNDIFTYPTYWLSRLQQIPGPTPLLLTLNIKRAKPSPQKILHTFAFSHPLPDTAAIIAQRRFAELNSGGRLYFCGAYWGNGFHEDGAVSGQQAAQCVAKDWL